ANEGKGLWVLKNSVTWATFWGGYGCCGVLFPAQLSSDCHSWCCRLAQEPHQSLDVLCRCCQEEHRTTVAVALRQIGKSLGAIAGIVLSPSTVSRAHVGVMPRSSNHCRNSPFPYVASAATDAGSRPCHWTGQSERSCPARLPSPDSAVLPCPALP